MFTYMTILLIKSPGVLGLSKGMIYFERFFVQDDYEISSINTDNNLQYCLVNQQIVSNLPLQSTYVKSIKYKISIKNIDAIYILHAEVKLTGFFLEKICENLIPIFFITNNSYFLFPFTLHGSPLARIIQLKKYSIQLDHRNMYKNLTDISYLSPFVSGLKITRVRKIMKTFDAVIKSNFPDIYAHQNTNSNFPNIELQSIYASFTKKLKSCISVGNKIDDDISDLSFLLLLTRWLHISIFMIILDDKEVNSQFNWLERNVSHVVNSLIHGGIKLREQTIIKTIKLTKMTERWDLMSDVSLGNSLLLSQITLIVLISGLIPHGPGVCFNLNIDLLLQLERQITFYLLLEQIQQEKNILIAFFERFFDNKLQFRGKILGSCHSFAKSLTMGDKYKFISSRSR